MAGMATDGMGASERNSRVYNKAILDRNRAVKGLHAAQMDLTQILDSTMPEESFRSPVINLISEIKTWLNHISIDMEYLQSFDVGSRKAEGETWWRDLEGAAYKLIQRAERFLSAIRATENARGDSDRWSTGGLGTPVNARPKPYPTPSRTEPPLADPRSRSLLFRCEDPDCEWNASGENPRTSEHNGKYHTPGEIPDEGVSLKSEQDPKTAPNHRTGNGSLREGTSLKVDSSTSSIPISHSNMGEFEEKVRTNVRTNIQAPGPDCRNVSMNRQNSSSYVHPIISQTNAANVYTNSNHTTNVSRFATKFRVFERKHRFALRVAQNSSPSDREKVKTELEILFSELETDPEAPDASIDRMYDMYAEVVEVLASAERLAQRASGSMSTSDPGRPSRSSYQCKLKSMANPVFDSTVRGYIRFRRKFGVLVEFQMSEELALLRLKEESIPEKSDAFQLVRGKQSLADCWAALDRVYKNPEVVKNAILKEANDLTRVSNRNDELGFRRLSNFVESASEDLEWVGMKHALGESAYAVLMTKIPQEVQIEIDKQVYDKTMNCSQQLDIFVKTCELYAAIAQASSSRNEAHNIILSKTESLSLGKGKGDARDGNLKGPSSMLAGTGAPGPTPEPKYDESKSEKGQKSNDQRSGRGNRKGQAKVCVLHPDTVSHHTVNCIRVNSTSAVEIKQKLEAAKQCLVCLLGHGDGGKCESKYRCPETGCQDPGSHHKLLHSAFVQPALGVGATSQSQEVGVNSESLLYPPKSPEELDALNSHLGVNTVRPCHEARLRGRNGKPFPVNVFYDGGSDLCQITKLAVSLTGLKPVNTLPKLLMQVAGKDVLEDWGECGLYIVPILDNKDNVVVELKCLAVDWIGTTKPCDVCKVVEMFQNNGNDITDLLDPVEGDIHILIGGNYPDLFPEVLSRVGSVVLGDVRFGKIVFGAHPTFPVQGYERKIPTMSLETVFSLGSVRLGTSVNSAVSTMLVATSAGLGKDDRDSYDQLYMVDEVQCTTCLKSSAEKDEDRRIDLYKECLTYDPDRKIFKTKMPWTEGYTDIPDNYASAYKRLMALTKSKQLGTDLKAWYVTEFQKIIDKGVLVEVAPEEAKTWNDNGGSVWYVAHFPVLNESSGSTPLRVVFDPTLKFRNLQIDNLWENPPNFIPNLTGLVLRFRERPISIAFDISKAYWSVYLEEPESHLHRVLWNNLDSSAQVKVYRIKRNSWGMRPAGSICSVAMLLIAEKHREEYPHVYNFVKSQLYVDDGTFSVDTVDEAVKLAKDTCFVLGEGGFALKHFIIGGKNLSVDESLKEGLPDLVRFGGSQEKILGLLWHPEDDTLSYKCRVNLTKKVRGARSGPDLVQEEYDQKFPQILTLRQYTSQVLSHFDPPGLTAAATIGMKHEMGLIHSLHLGWDGPIPHSSENPEAPTNHERCKAILRIFYDLSRIVFPRCLRPLSICGQSSPILVVFGDASQLAYCAVAYFVWKHGDGSLEPRLVMAKAKPLPKKAPLLTIPRAECMAAVTAVQLAKLIGDHTSYSIESRMFLVDSTIILCQIAMPANRLKQWVASKMDIIHSHAKTSEFYHLASELNVADDGSRGLHPREIGLESRWQCGEPFMRNPISEWPIVPLREIARNDHASASSFLELRHRDPRFPVSHSLIASVFQPYRVPSGAERALIEYLFKLEIPDIKNDDTWVRAKRRVTRIMHFLEKCTEFLRDRERSRRLKSLRSCKVNRVPENFSLLPHSVQYQFICENDKFSPSVTQLELAARYWIMRAQTLLDGNLITSMRKLNPERGDDGIWRAHGRTSHVKSPLIIIPNCRLAEVLLLHFHGTHHSGAQATLAAAREHYWIINGQKLANRLTRNCVRCRKLRRKCVNVEMAPARQEQTKRSEVFQVVCLDLCGHYMAIPKSKRVTRTSSNSSTGLKVWVLVIVCVSSHAVHLELLEGYDTSSFLIALDNFMSIRATPQKIIADRGSQVIGARNTVTYVWEELDKSTLRNSTKIEWEFIPSGAHSFLGLAERSVQTFKRTMEAVHYSRSPRFTKLEFSRVLYSLANIMNSRPLGIRHTKSSTLEDDRLVRPNDLLLGRASAEITPSVAFDSELNLTTRKDAYLALLKQKEAFVHEFWIKFQPLAFKSLFPREKWLQSDQNVSKGDVVLIRNSSPIVGYWTWGEIHEVHPSADGMIRKTSVRYKDPSGKSRFVVKSVRDLCMLLRANERRTSDG